MNKNNKKYRAEMIRAFRKALDDCGINMIKSGKESLVDDSMIMYIIGYVLKTQALTKKS